MSAESSHALDINLLLYQNKQLARLVRVLRSEVQQGFSDRDTSRSGGSKSVSDELETLMLRNRQLEARISRYESTGKARYHGGPDSTDSFVRSENDVCSDESKSAVVICNKCADLEEECTRLSTSLAISHSRSFAPFPIQSSDDIMISLQAVKDERDMLISRMKMSQESLFSLRDEVESRLLKFEQSCSSNKSQFEQEIDRISLDMQDRTEPQVAATQLLAASGVETFNSFEQKTSGDEVYASDSKLRDQLRLKEEQLSRTLMQHINQQILIKQTETENTLLLSRITADAVSNVAGDLLQSHFAEMVTNNKARFEEWHREMCERDKTLEICIENLRQLDGIVFASEAANQKSSRVIEELQTELKCVNGRISEAKRMRLTGATGNTSLLGLEFEDLKQRIKCTLCGVREKSVALVGCMHCFCRECVDQQMLGARNRKCPLCNQRFADAEVREVHFLHS